MGWREMQTITAKRVFSYEGWSVDRNEPYKASGGKMEAGMTSCLALPSHCLPQGAAQGSHRMKRIPFRVRTVSAGVALTVKGFALVCIVAWSSCVSYAE